VGKLAFIFRIRATNFLVIDLFCFLCSIATLPYHQEDGVFDDICHIDIIASMVSQELKERAIKSISL
jgi:hypothetical protein